MKPTLVLSAVVALALGACAPSRTTTGTTEGGATGSGGSQPAVASGGGTGQGSGGSSSAETASGQGGAAASSSSGGAGGSASLQGGAGGGAGAASLGGTTAKGSGQGGRASSGGSSSATVKPGSGGTAGTSGSGPAAGGAGGAQRAVPVLSGLVTSTKMLARPRPRSGPQHGARSSSSYGGPLYQVQRASDQQTKDIAVGPGGFANSADQDSFCSGTSCTIRICVPSRSPNGNHLRVTWFSNWLPKGAIAANATDAKITVGGHTVYGIKHESATNSGVGYRTGTQLSGTASVTKGSTTVTFTDPQTLAANVPLMFVAELASCSTYNCPMFLTAAAITAATTVTLQTAYSGPSSSSTVVSNKITPGVATGDGAESMYSVFDAKVFGQWCCFDYGSAEMDGVDDGNATMEAISWAADTQFGQSGGGNGPWVGADLENGMYEGYENGSAKVASNTSVTGFSYVTAMLKGLAAPDCPTGIFASGCFELRDAATRPQASWRSSSTPTPTAMAHFRRATVLRKSKVPSSWVPGEMAPTRPTVSGSKVRSPWALRPMRPTTSCRPTSWLPGIPSDARVKGWLKGIDLGVDRIRCVRDPPTAAPPICAARLRGRSLRTVLGRLWRREPAQSLARRWRARELGAPRVRTRLIRAGARASGV